MMKKVFVIGICMIFVSMILGCTNFLGTGTTNETKLEDNQGLGVIGTLNIDEMHPGLDGYISLTIRNNLGGESASDVYVSLDNVEPFKIFDCGDFHSNSSEKRACAGAFGMDSELPYRTHGESKMFPGEELEFYWRLRAPSKDEISNIALRHPIYFDLEYDYKTTFVQNIIFMSQQEVLRRRQAGEAFEVEGEANSGAGELIVSGTTKQPVIYFFQEPTNIQSEENPFDFALRYNVENIGEGIPLSDVVVLVEIPKGKFGSEKDIEPDTEAMKEYGWKYWTEMKFLDETLMIEGFGGYCNTGKETDYCTEWIMESYGNEFEDIFGTAISEDRLLVKVVKRTEFLNEFDMYLPLTIVGNDDARGMTALKNFQIPIQIYGFKVHNLYRYFTEGQEEIVVYPIRI